VAEVRRFLRAFEREPGDDLIEEWPLDELSLSDLQALFGVGDDDPMYDSFRVTEEHAEPLRRVTSADIDLRQYEYFVEADTV
jgi:hypothetical protein